MADLVAGGAVIRTTDADIARAGWTAQTWFYVKQTRKEVCSSKLNYCLGFAACLLVVVVAAVVMSVLANAPVVFLRLAEADVGEIDLVITPATWTGRLGLNYSLLASALAVDSAYSYHAPRVRFTGSAFHVARCDAPAAALAAAAGADTQWTYPSAAALGDECTDATLDGYDSCLDRVCETFSPEPIVASVYAIDTRAEQRMGLGREYRNGPLARGEALVRTALARQLGLGVGDTIHLSVETSNAFPALFYEAAYARVRAPGYNATADGGGRGAFDMRVNVAFTVVGLLPSSLGKFSSSDTKAIIVELDPLLDTLADAADAAWPFPHASLWRAHSLREYCDEVALNMPAPRIEAYRHADYDVIQREVMTFSARAVYLIGFNQLDVDQPIVETLRGTRFFALFLGLILNIIVFILTGLSVLLLYSLLIVNVETRTFDMGVMRMLGMTKVGIFALLLMQAFAYALPAYVIGMVVSQLFFWALARVFQTVTAVAISPLLSRDGIVLATCLGMVIPTVSAVFPVLKAFGQSLVESLNVYRSKTAAVKVSVNRSEDGAFSWSLVVVGAALAVFGFLIYYLLPLALLSFNLSLLLYIFFGVLIGMIIGCALLALNAQPLLERIFVWTFLWWDSSAVRAVVLKNLVAHRVANRKTTLMYSISLAVIIFISVSFSLQIQTFIYQTRQRDGALVVVNAPSSSQLATLEGILAQDASVRDWGYVSVPLVDLATNASATAATNIGQFFSVDVDVIGVSPNLFTVAFAGFLTVAKSPEGLAEATLTAQLYGARGSHSALVSSNYRQSLGLVHLDQAFVVETTVSTPNGEGRVLRRLTPAAYVDSAPVLKFSKFPNAEGTALGVSLPTFARLAGRSTRAALLPLASVVVKLDETASERARDELIFKLRQFSVTDYRDSIAPLEAAETVLSYFFLFATVTAMLISFFSLSSSMFANIQKQTKEIAILRALGATRARMTRIYVYEAFVLVFSSACAGILVGVIVAWTMTLQRVLFIQLPIPFVFPWRILIAVLFASALSALSSSFWPIFRLVREPIVALFRK